MSDDVTAKVLAETWATTGDLGLDRVLPLPPIALMWAAHDSQTDGEAHARNRLAACAPEALRLLLEAEWAGGEPESVYEAGVDDVCPWCRELKLIQNPKPRAVCSDEPYFVDGEHAPDCRWLALMKKAGLR